MNVIHPEAPMDREMAVLTLGLARAIAHGQHKHSSLRFGPYRIRAHRTGLGIRVQILMIRSHLRLIDTQLNSEDLLPQASIH